jgi:hypothetical protein
MGTPEDEFIDRYFRTANRNPNRIGCPSRDVLVAAARRDSSVPLEAIDHFAKCSECTLEISAIRNHLRARHWRWVASGIGVIAAVLAVAILFSPETKRLFWPGSHNVTSLAHLKRTTDLFDEPDTMRDAGGEQPQFKKLSLPSAPLEWTVVLPRFSRPGVYQLAICRDRTESSAVVKAVGRAVSSGSREIVTVMVDLSGIKQGSYYIATRGEDEAGSYFFPVTITSGG